MVNMNNTMNDTTQGPVTRDLIKLLELAEIALINARHEAGKVDDLNGDRLNGHVRRVYPCNQAVVHATQPALDAIRAVLANVNAGGAQ